MEDWHVDYINEACVGQFAGKAECVVVSCKGRILLATRAFSAGDVIFVESPLLLAVADAEHEAYQEILRLHTEDPETFCYKPLWYWAALCSLTAEQLQGTSSLQPVTIDQQRRMLCLYHEPVKKASKAVKVLVQRLGLTVSPVLVEELLSAWILNCFEHSEEPEGYAAYFASSFVSHSCRPNATWYETAGAVHVLRARQDIRVGEEICISYLSEEGLLACTDVRRRTLKKTKLFVCTCERCDASQDLCRGFRCPFCTECAVFFPLSRHGAAEVSLRDAVCGACGRCMGVHAEGLLEAEACLKRRVAELDRANSSLFGAPEVAQLLRLLGDAEAGAVGPRHWLCERLWSHLARWYEERGDMDEALRMVRLRLTYQRDACAWLSGAHAWTLEAQAHLLLRSFFGVASSASRREGPGGSKRRKQLANEAAEADAVAGVDAATLQRAAARAVVALEEAARILRIMFGEHKYVFSVEKKRRKALELAAALVPDERADAVKRPRLA